MSEQKSETLFTAIVQLLLSKRAFIKCPNCGKSLGLFEVYNENCSFCGKIKYDSMFVMQGLEKEEN